MKAITFFTWKLLERASSSSEGANNVIREQWRVSFSMLKGRLITLFAWKWYLTFYNVKTNKDLMNEWMNVYLETLVRGSSSSGGVGRWVCTRSSCPRRRRTRGCSGTGRSTEIIFYKETVSDFWTYRSGLEKKRIHMDRIYK